MVLFEAAQDQRPAVAKMLGVGIGDSLKRTKGNFAKNSKHHVRQSTFIGSKRYIRGQVLKSLSENQQLSLEQLQERIGDERLPAVLADLQKEGFLMQKQDHVSLRE